MIDWRAPAGLVALGARAARRRSSSSGRCGGGAQALETLRRSALAAGRWRPIVDLRRQRWRAAMLLRRRAAPGRRARRPDVGLPLGGGAPRRRRPHRRARHLAQHARRGREAEPPRARQAGGAGSLVKQLKGDRIGLVAFAGSAFVQCPLTLDYDAFAESLRAVDGRHHPAGRHRARAKPSRTSIGALEGHQGKHEALILITDGEDHEGNIDDAIKQAAERGVKIYTVGIGTAGRRSDPVTVNGQQSSSRTATARSSSRGSTTTTLKKIAHDHRRRLRARRPARARARHGSTPTTSRTWRNASCRARMERRFEDRFQFPLAARVRAAA